MSGRISFGCDFLHIMRELQLRGADQMDTISDAAARLFLLQWGLSVEEGDQANLLFWERVNEESLEDPVEVMQRIADHVKDDLPRQHLLITQLAAIASLDADFAQEEHSYITFFQHAFDMRPSEFMNLCERGWDFAVGLDFFGREYLREKTGMSS